MIRTVGDDCNTEGRSTETIRPTISRITHLRIRWALASSSGLLFSFTFDVDLKRNEEASPKLESSWSCSESFVWMGKGIVPPRRIMRDSCVKISYSSCSRGCSNVQLETWKGPALFLLSLAVNARHVLSKGKKEMRKLEHTFAKQGNRNRT